MEHGESAPIWTKRFILLFLTNMSVFFVFYSLVTTLPLYALEVLKQSEKEAALLLSVFLLSAIIVRPFSGKLLDIFGKKRLLISSLIFYFVSTVLYLAIKPLLLLLVLRFFHGIWFSLITTALGSLAADIVPESRKGAGLGYFAMSSNLSVVIGPFIGLLMIQYSSYTMLFFVLSAVVLIGIVMASTITVDDLLAVTSHWRSITFHDLLEKKALVIASIAALVAFSYASVLSFISTYAHSLGMMQLASWFYAVFAAAMLITRPTTGKLYDQRGPSYVIIPGFIFFGVGILLLAFVSGPMLFLLAGICVGIGYGALTTSLQSLAVQSTEATRSAYATATYFTLFDLGIMVGTYILGVVAANSSYMGVYIIAAGLVAVTAVLYSIRLRVVSR